MKENKKQKGRGLDCVMGMFILVAFYLIISMPNHDSLILLIFINAFLLVIDVFLIRDLLLNTKLKDESEKVK